MEKGTRMKEGIFRRRPNRFIAEVEVDGLTAIAHVPNTGRCAELLVPGARALLVENDNPARKTRYTLHYIENKGVLVNLYSVSANQAVCNSLEQGLIEELSGATGIRREVSYERSRIDLFCLCDGVETYIEVKGVTLIKDGCLQFPDAPTLRGTRHVEELIRIRRSGRRAVAFFVAQHPLGEVFRANRENDPAFADRLKEAVEEGVEVLVYRASASPGEYLLEERLPYLIE